MSYYEHLSTHDLVAAESTPLLDEHQSVEDAQHQSGDDEGELHDDKPQELVVWHLRDVYEGLTPKACRSGVTAFN